MRKWEGENEVGLEGEGTFEKWKRRISKEAGDGIEEGERQESRRWEYMRKEVGRSREKIGYGGLDTEMETVRKNS